MVSSLLNALIFALVFGGVRHSDGLPDGNASATIRAGDVIPGTPLALDILDVQTGRARDCTLVFWMNAQKTKPASSKKVLLGLGTENTAFINRYDEGFFQTRNTPWNERLQMSMGYSSVEPTWVSIGLTIKDERVTLYFDGFPTEEQPLSNAFTDVNFGREVGFVHLPADNGDDIQVTGLLFELRVWPASDIREHVLSTNPNEDSSYLDLTRVPEQGFANDTFRKVFREEFLFGPMPAPFTLPRLLFGPDDIPKIQKLYESNDQMKAHKINAEFMLEELMSSRLQWLSNLAKLSDPTDTEAHELVNLLFASIIVGRDDAHKLLAESTMRIVRSKKARLEAAVSRFDKSVAWELTGMVDLYHMDALALMLDLSGPKLSLQEITEGIGILAIGVRGRRAIYSRHVTQQPFNEYAESRKHAIMRYTSNKNAWFGSTLVTIQLLLHGHPGLHDPSDIYATYNLFREHIRSQLSPAGLSSESAGKTAVWRGFLPWIMLARHRIPGLSECMWNAQRLQTFASAKQLQIIPSAPILLDHGTWALSTPREYWKAFHTFIDAGRNSRENLYNAWLARLADPHLPLKPEYVRRLLQERGTGLLEPSTAAGSRVPLLFYDEGFPVQPVVGPGGGFRNSERSCVVSAETVAESSKSWRVNLRIKAASDGSTDGKLLALFEEGDDENAALTLSIVRQGAGIEMRGGNGTVFWAMSPGRWHIVQLTHDAGQVSLWNSGKVPFVKSGRFYVLLGALSSLTNRLSANQGASTAAVRDVAIEQSGSSVIRWNSYPPWSFGRTLRKQFSLHSMFDSHHWTETLPHVNEPTNRYERNVFDDSIGYYFFSNSVNPRATAVAVFSQDTSGGHVFKAGGHFDVFGRGTAWLFVENRFAVLSDDYSLVLVDGKRAPGLNDAEQAVSTGGRVTNDGSWVTLNLKWFYRHKRLIHNTNFFGYDESEPLTSDAVPVRTATRAVTSVNFGNALETVVIVADQIAMFDNSSHEFTWLGQVFQRHGVRFDSNPPSGLLDIWLDGDVDYDFHQLDERVDAPMSVTGVDSPDQYSARNDKRRQCLIRVLRAGGSDSVSFDVSNRYRHYAYGQSTPHQVFDKPQGDFNLKIGKRIRVTAKSKTADFVVAIYAMDVGAPLPKIEWDEKNNVVRLSKDGFERVVRRDGSIG